MNKPLDDDDKNLSNPLLPFNVWPFGFIWVLLHIVTGLIFDYLLLNINPFISISLPLSMPVAQRQLIFSAFELLKSVIFSLGYGTIIGGIEWYILNRYFQWPKSWIIFTIAGTIISGFWQRITLNFMFPAIIVFIFFVRETVSGGIFGAFQWVVLRKTVYGASWWILASILGGFISALLIEGIFRVGILETLPADYSIILLSYQALGSLASETIKVVCLIALLYFTLKQDELMEEVG